MRYSAIKKYDIANGDGIRVSLFVSGCTHHCKGCFNQSTWSFDSGDIFTKSEISLILDELSKDYVTGFSLLGGEPLEIVNQRGVLPLLRLIKNNNPEKTIWCYTGYVYEEDLCEGGNAFCDITKELLSYIDVLVDGPFIESLKDISLVYRGSSNQRVIDLKKTLETGKIVSYF
jgi:anaerobic ribonucleoside-triphosphate reductase activating protein